MSSFKLQNKHTFNLTPSRSVGICEIALYKLPDRKKVFQNFPNLFLKILDIRILEFLSAAKSLDTTYSEFKRL